MASLKKHNVWLILALISSFLLIFGLSIYHKQSGVIEEAGLNIGSTGTIDIKAAKNKDTTNTGIYMTMGLGVFIDNKGGYGPEATNAEYNAVEYYKNWMPSLGETDNGFVVLPTNTSIQSDSLDSQIGSMDVHYGWYDSSSGELKYGIGNSWDEAVVGLGVTPNSHTGGVFKPKLKEIFQNEGLPGLAKWETIFDADEAGYKQKSAEVWRYINGTGLDGAVFDRFIEYMGLADLDLNNITGWTNENREDAFLSYLDLLLTCRYAVSGSQNASDRWTHIINGYLNEGPGVDSSNYNMIIVPVSLAVTDRNTDNPFVIAVSVMDAVNWAYKIQNTYNLSKKEGSNLVAGSEFNAVPNDTAKAQLLKAITANVDALNCGSQEYPAVSDFGWKFLNTGLGKSLNFTDNTFKDYGEGIIDKMWLTSKDGSKYYGKLLVLGIPLATSPLESKSLKSEFKVLWANDGGNYIEVGTGQESLQDTAALIVSLDCPDEEVAAWDNLCNTYEKFYLSFNIKSESANGGKDTSKPRHTETTVTEDGVTCTLDNPSYTIDGTPYVLGTKIEVTREVLRKLIKGEMDFTRLYDKATRSQVIALSELQTFGYDLNVTIYYESADGTSGGSYVTDWTGWTYDTSSKDKEQHQVTAFRPNLETNDPKEGPKVSWYSEPEAYAEIKEGYVDYEDTGSHEAFEAMAGVPSTEMLYFASGGSEFIVELELQHVQGEEGYRLYGSSFSGTECEFKHNDAFWQMDPKNGTETYKQDGVDDNVTSVAITSHGNTLQTGEHIISKFLVADEKGYDTNVNYSSKTPAQWYKWAVPGTGGGSNSVSYNVSLSGHSHDWNHGNPSGDAQMSNTSPVTATWTGSIKNQTPFPGWSQPYVADTFAQSGSCPSISTSGSQAILEVLNTPQTNWNTTDYNNAIQEALNWAKAYEATNETYTVKTLADSDGFQRIWRIGKATINVSLSGGSNGEAIKPNGTGSYKGGTYTTDNLLDAQKQSNDHASLGGGWGYTQGTLATVTISGPGGCPHDCSQQWNTPPSTDSEGNPVPGVPHTHTHSHQTWSKVASKPGTNSASADYSFTVKVNFDNASIDAHELCGTCCTHDLPLVADYWVQRMKYDYARLNVCRVYKIYRSYVDGVEEITFADYMDEDDIANGGDHMLYSGPIRNYTKDIGAFKSEANFPIVRQNITNDDLMGDVSNKNRARQVISASEQAKLHNGTDTIVAAINQGDPNIFYNIGLMSNVDDNTYISYAHEIEEGIPSAMHSLAGRVRYSLGAQTHHYMSWTEFSQRGDYSASPEGSGPMNLTWYPAIYGDYVGTRSNKCDGMTQTIGGSNPVKVNPNGHAIPTVTLGDAPWFAEYNPKGTAIPNFSNGITYTRYNNFASLNAKYYEGGTLTNPMTFDFERNAQQWFTTEDEYWMATTEVANDYSSKSLDVGGTVENNGGGVFSGDGDGGGSYSFPGYDQTNNSTSKTKYTGNSIDAIDYETEEYHRFRYRRNMRNTLYVISDMLILQTSTGDQPVMYHWKSQTKRAQQHYDYVASDVDPKMAVFDREITDQSITLTEKFEDMWLNQHHGDSDLTDSVVTMTAQGWGVNNIGTDEAVNVGGYLGLYSQPDRKFSSGVNNNRVGTLFDGVPGDMGQAFNDENMGHGMTQGDDDNYSDTVPGTYNVTATNVIIMQDYYYKRSPFRVNKEMGYMNFGANKGTTAKAHDPDGDGFSYTGVGSDGYGLYNGFSTRYLGTQMLWRYATTVDNPNPDMYKSMAGVHGANWGESSLDYWRAGGLRMAPPGGALRIVTDKIQMDPTNPNKEYETGTAIQSYMQILDWPATDIGEMNYVDITKDSYGRGRPGNTKRYEFTRKDAMFKSRFPSETINVTDEDRTGDDYTDLLSASGHLLTMKDYATMPGYTIEATYSKAHNKINDIVIHTPVSVQNSALIHNLEAEHNDWYADTRTDAEDITSTALEQRIEELQVCSGDPDTCQFKVLNCVYGDDAVLFSSDFDNGVTTKNGKTYVTNLANPDYVYQLPDGFTVTSMIKYYDEKTGEIKEFDNLTNPTAFTKSNKNFLSCFGTRWAIPLSDLGITYSTDTRIKIDMDFYMNDSKDKGTMLISFNGYDFYIPGGRYQGIGTWNTGNGWERKYPTVDLLDNEMKLTLIFDFGDAYKSELYLNGVKLDNVEIVNAHQTVTQDKVIGTSGVTNTLNIGSWGRGDGYPAQFFIDNLKITQLSKGKAHTDECYQIVQEHEKVQEYTCAIEFTYEYGKPHDGWNADRPYIFTAYETGIYRVEAWGAAGGGGTLTQGANSSGGAGGYSRGYITLQEGEQVIVYPGGAGSTTPTTTTGTEYFWILTTDCGNYSSFAGNATETMSGISYINSVTGKEELTNTSLPGIWSETCPTGYNCSNHSVSVAMKDGKMVQRTAAGNSPTGYVTETTTFNYTGDVQTFKPTTTGLYKLEAWGASGGGTTTGSGTSHGGKGGYSVGYATLEAGKTYYVYVGGQGKLSTGFGNGGGYNGGGHAGPAGYGGGGMSHVSTTQNLATAKIDVSSRPAEPSYFEGKVKVNGVGTYHVMDFVSPVTGTMDLTFYCSNGHLTGYYILDSLGNKTDTGNVHGGTYSEQYVPMYNVSLIQGATYSLYLYSTCSNFAAPTAVNGSRETEVTASFSTVGGITETYGATGSWNPDGTLIVAGGGGGADSSTDNFKGGREGTDLIPESAGGYGDGSGGYGGGTSGENAYINGSQSVSTTSIRFDYTGGVQEYVAPVSGYYTLEAWGASGGGNVQAYTGSGGYTKGTTYLDKGDKLYIYVGESGKRQLGSAIAPNTFNGGGNGAGSTSLTLDGHQGGSGGGATDFRLVGGSWDNLDGLKSRILVAGGGGGSGCASNHNPGDGGGLVGATTLNSVTGYTYYGASASGGSQTSAGASVGTWKNNDRIANNGGFGKGSDAVQCAAGGGGGYYGGGSEYTAGGGGGSSYVTGYSGCDTTYRSLQGGYNFTNVVMQQGGTVGNGYAIITAPYVTGGAGTQTTGFMQGVGESAIDGADTGGAGAGWYGGHSTNNSNGGGAGGSGYLSSALTDNNTPDTPAKTTGNVNSGNGKVVISKLEATSTDTFAGAGFNGGGSSGLGGYGGGGASDVRRLSNGGHYVLKGTSQALIETTEYNGDTYIKVFDHDTTVGGLFKSLNEAQNCNVSGRYSILNAIDSYKATGEKYQFMLYYPESGKRNIWKQSKNPLQEKLADITSGSKASGYEAIKIEMDGNYWGGLTRSTSTVTLLDGSVGHGNWFYAVGSNSFWGDGPTTIPGGNSASINKVQLWMKVDADTIDEMNEGKTAQALMSDSGTIVYGPYISASSGTYQVDIYGSGLADCTFDVYANALGGIIYNHNELLDLKISPNHISFYFNLESPVEENSNNQGLEIRMHRNSGLLPDYSFDSLFISRLEDRIVVAGGGGGADNAAGSGTSDDGSGGVGGGDIGGNAKVDGVETTPGKALTDKLQAEVNNIKDSHGAWKSIGGISASGCGLGGGQDFGYELGRGESVTYNTDSGGAGGGYYGGFVTNHGNGGGGGGSGYISSEAKDYTLTSGVNTGNGKVRIEFVSHENTETLTQSWGYTGAVQSYTITESGLYRLEVWGAQGGMYTSGNQGAKGGYATGVYSLSKGQTIYIYTGQKGYSYPQNHSISAPFNGGGEGYGGGGDGGGASDIRLGGTALSNRIIVAGGGGGSDLDGMGGVGGNEIGGSASKYDSAVNAGREHATGGTQLSGGYSAAGTNEKYTGGLGFGGSAMTTNDGAGGGGGYYGGGAGWGGHSAAGGGSSYIGKVLYGQMLDGGSEQPSPTVKDGTQIGNSGNGYARITKLNRSHLSTCTFRNTEYNYHEHREDCFYDNHIVNMDNLNPALKGALIADYYGNTNELRTLLGSEVYDILHSGSERALFTLNAFTDANFKGLRADAYGSDTSGYGTGTERAVLTATAPAGDAGGGNLVLTPKASDSWLYLDTNINAGSVTKITARVKYTGVEPEFAQLFWKTPTASFNGNYQVRAVVEPGGNWQTITWYLDGKGMYDDKGKALTPGYEYYKGSEYWKRTITGLRFDFIGNNANQGKVEISDITFYGTEGATDLSTYTSNFTSETFDFTQDLYGATKAGEASVSKSSEGLQISGRFYGDEVEMPIEAPANAIQYVTVDMKVNSMTSDTINEGHVFRLWARDSAGNMVGDLAVSNTRAWKPQYEKQTIAFYVGDLWRGKDVKQIYLDVAQGDTINNSTVTLLNMKVYGYLSTTQKGTKSENNFTYTGNRQQFTPTKTGSYLLEVWGAQGGDGRIGNADTIVSGSGGKGGYSQGYATLTAGTTYYIYVGGKGGSAGTASLAYGAGGYNGGGAGGTELAGETYPENGAGGGGMTHITTSSTDDLRRDQKITTNTTNNSSTSGSVQYNYGNGGFDVDKWNSNSGLDYMSYFLSSVGPYPTRISSGNNTINLTSSTSNTTLTPITASSNKTYNVNIGFRAGNLTHNMDITNFKVVINGTSYFLNGAVSAGLIDNVSVVANDTSYTKYNVSNFASSGSATGGVWASFYTTFRLKSGTLSAVSFTCGRASRPGDGLTINATSTTVTSTTTRTIADNTVYSFNPSAAIIVAGGGGGGTGSQSNPPSSYVAWGGAGGGTSGVSHNTVTTPGTQSSGYTRQGLGANGYSHNGTQNLGSSGGGGGGWYGGDTGTTTSTGTFGGAGGSGYLSSQISGGTTTADVREGNGYARISISNPTILAKTSGQQKLTIKFASSFVTDINNLTNAVSAIAQYTDSMTNDVGPTIPREVNGTVNPIYYCWAWGYNKHICNEVCEKEDKVLKCFEPHHDGMHYETTEDAISAALSKAQQGAINQAQAEYKALDKEFTEAEYNLVLKQATDAFYANSNWQNLHSCYEACNNDDNHKKISNEVVINGNKINEFYINTDEYFDIWFPNTGDFEENPDLHGIRATVENRGMGYEDDMDTGRYVYTKDSQNYGNWVSWVRERYVRFSFDVLFYRAETGLWEQYTAGEWIELPVEGTNNNIGYNVDDKWDDGHPRYHFYCTLNNNEQASGKIEFESEAINCSPGEDKYNYHDNYGYTGGWVYETITGEKLYRTLEYRNDRVVYNEVSNHMNDNDNYKDETNADRRVNLTSLHGAHAEKYIDVVGRIGNIAITSTTDIRFINFFKRPNPTGSYLINGIVQEVYEDIQRDYLTWHYNNGNLAYDVRHRQVSRDTALYNTWGSSIWKGATKCGVDSTAKENVTQDNIDNEYELNAPTGLNCDNHAADVVAGHGVDAKDSTTFPLSSDKNNIDIYTKELLKPGYTINYEITTTGNYHNRVQVKPYFYALDVEENKLIPVDVYMKTDDEYRGINYFGAADGLPLKWTDGSISSLGDEEIKEGLSSYILSLDWDEEADLRMYTDMEKELTEAISRNFIEYNFEDKDGHAQVGDGELPLPEAVRIPAGDFFKLGNLQSQIVGNQARTFLGTRYTMYENFRHSNGENGMFSTNVVATLHDTNIWDAVDNLEYTYKAQRWHLKLGLPSSAVFTLVENGVHYDPLEEKMVDGQMVKAYEETANGKYAIVMTVNIQAIGDVWNLYYTQEKHNGTFKIGDKRFSIDSDLYHFTTGDVADSQIVLAIYDNNTTSEVDVDTIGTH